MFDSFFDSFLDSFLGSFVGQIAPLTTPRDTISAIAADLGFEVIDFEQAQGGLLRIFIDHIDPTPPQAESAAEESDDAVELGPRGERLITIDHCELLTRQLMYQLPVEGVDFERLEVSSPGMDRRLCTSAHFRRFVGDRIKLRTRMPVDGRRNFEGPLGLAQGEDEFTVAFEGAGGIELSLSFRAEDVELARLVPEFPLKEKRR